MKALLFLPLTFLAGVDGFLLFAPYLLTILLLGFWMARHRPVLASISTSRREPAGP